MSDVFALRLSHLPMPAKLLLTAVLFTLGTGYLFAIGNIFFKIGFFPDEVALKYYGNPSSREAIEALQNDTPPDATEETLIEGDSFSFDDLEQETGSSDDPIVPIPTLETLVSEGHFHLFGYTSIFFLCGLVLLFSELTAWLKNTLILAPFVASVLDIWSMLLTRFIGPGFAWMLVISGTVMAVSFLLVFLIGIKQLWFTKTPA